MNIRNVLIDSLTRIAQKDKRIVLLSGDIGFMILEGFAKKHPDRFINVGVAEQNMIGLAAGLSLTGYLPVCYTIASFAVTRNYEHIKVSVASQKLPVIIIGVGAGLSFSTASVTHHALDDIALMRNLPNMNIFSPADATEAEFCLKTAIRLRQPAYIRVSKSDEPDVVKAGNKLNFGKADLVKKGEKVAILATGPMVNSVLSAQKYFDKKLTPEIYSLHTIKPIDSNLIRKLTSKFKLIVTVEEHSVVGGLGSVVADRILQNNPDVKLLTIGTPDKFIFKIGSLDYVRNFAGLSPQKIARKIISRYNSIS